MSSQRCASHICDIKSNEGARGQDNSTICCEHKLFVETAFRFKRFKQSHRDVRCKLIGGRVTARKKKNNCI